MRFTHVALTLRTPSPSETEQLSVRPGEQINEAQRDEKQHQIKSGALRDVLAEAGSSAAHLDVCSHQQNKLGDAREES